MHPTLLARWACVALLSTTLAACGGGGGGGDDIPAPPAGPGTPGTPGTVTGQYRLETSPTTANSGVAAMNTLGQQGFGFVSSLATYTTPTGLGDVYVKDSAHAASKLQYVALTPATTATAALAQMNQQGALGYLYKGDAGFGSGAGMEFRSMFVRDTTRTTTYTYERQPATAPMPKGTLLTQLNAQGARGFRFMAMLTTNAGGEYFNLYTKSSAETGTYAYTFVDVASPFGTANGAALKAQLNAKGATGAMFLSAFVVDNFNTGVQIYEKSSVHNTPITYDVVAVDRNDTLAGLVAKANVRAAASEFLYGDLVTDDGNFHRVYVKGAPRLSHPLAGPVFP